MCRGAQPARSGEGGRRLASSSHGRATVVPLGAGRSLKTAAEALATLRLLGANPDGVTAEALGLALGKSASTARYLLNTLCQEGYAFKDGPAGVHRLVETPPWGEAWGRPQSDEIARAVAQVAAVATREWRAQVTRVPADPEEDIRPPP